MMGAIMEEQEEAVAVDTIHQEEKGEISLLIREMEIAVAAEAQIQAEEVEAESESTEEPEEVESTEEEMEGMLDMMEVLVLRVAVAVAEDMEIILAEMEELAKVVYMPRLIFRLFLMVQIRLYC
jgi:hypothetical protein